MQNLFICVTYAGVCIVNKSLQYACRRAYNESICHSTHAGVRIAASPKIILFVNSILDLMGNTLPKTVNLNCFSMKSFLNY